MTKAASTKDQLASCIHLPLCWSFICYSISQAIFKPEFFLPIKRLLQSHGYHHQNFPSIFKLNLLPSFSPCYTDFWCPIYSKLFFPFFIFFLMKNICRPWFLAQKWIFCKVNSESFISLTCLRRTKIKVNSFTLK